MGRLGNLISVEFSPEVVDGLSEGIPKILEHRPDSGRLDQFRECSIRCAKEFRARCRRLFTVPRFTPVISEISS